MSEDVTLPRFFRTRRSRACHLMRPVGSAGWWVSWCGMVRCTEPALHHRPNDLPACPVCTELYASKTMLEPPVGATLCTRDGRVFVQRTPEGWRRFSATEPSRGVIGWPVVLAGLADGYLVVLPTPREVAAPSWDVRPELGGAEVAELAGGIEDVEPDVVMAAELDVETGADPDDSGFFDDDLFDLAELDDDEDEDETDEAVEQDGVEVGAHARYDFEHEDVEF